MAFFQKQSRISGSDHVLPLKTLEQLEVDICNTPDSVVVYAQVSGCDISDISISVEDDANVIVIEGTRRRPKHSAFTQQEQDNTFYTKECVWGEFYRRIILPTNIDVASADAEIQDGVLILQLPIRKRK